MEEIESYLKVIGVDVDPDDISSSEEGYKLYKRANDLKKELEKKRKKLRGKLFELAEKETEPDQKGHYTLEFEDGGFQKQARTSVKLQEEKVLEYAKENNLDKLYFIEKEINRDMEEEIIEVLEKHLPEAVVEKEKVDEQELETAVYEEEIPYEKFEEFVEKKTSYALIDLS